LSPMRSRDDSLDDYHSSIADEMYTADISINHVTQAMVAPIDAQTSRCRHIVIQDQPPDRVPQMSHLVHSTVNAHVAYCPHRLC
uniref:Pecanex-like protein n=1 Tax=Angiostrongylus cantonensis TaxID=6313 RepID=A0A158P7L3_ANGCA